MSPFVPRSGLKVESDDFFNVDDTQVEFEIKFFARILDRRPLDIELLRRQAELLSFQGRHEECLVIVLRLRVLAPEDGIVRYNLACTLSMLERAEEAVAALREALELGYHDFAHLESDPDLDSLRSLASYRKTIAQLL